MLKEQGQAQLVAEIDRITEAAALVKSDIDMHNYFRKDMSKIMQTNGKTVYAVDLTNLNEVEKAFHFRDQRIERCELPVILREEEHKKHVKDGTLPAACFYPVAAKQEVEAVDQPVPLEKKAQVIQESDLMTHDISSHLVFHSENKDKRYCICAKQNDNHQYVLCEDECDWYHPECVGFDLLMFESNANIKFICPYCKKQTKEKLMEGERKCLFSKMESTTKKNFFVFIPQKGAQITQQQN